MLKPIIINKVAIGPGRKPYVVAEIGVNHNGRLDLALKLIDAAAKAGADAVKFQTFRAEEVTTVATPIASYQAKNTGRKQSMQAMIRKLELNERFYPRLISHSRKRKVAFFSAAQGGFVSVDLLERLGVPMFKIGSGDLTNLPLLRYVARLKKPIILGTGMATMVEIQAAIKTMKGAGNDKIIGLQCTTDYPADPREANLAVIPEMIKKIKTLVGYSDHTMGIRVPLMAATLGACMIEKHFTLNRGLAGPDHKASATPAELQQLVKAVKFVPAILGKPIKRPSRSELPYLPLIRKSVVAARDIAKGEKFTRKNLAIKRPGTGLAPRYFDALIGRIAKRDLPKDNLISLSDVK